MQDPLNRGRLKTLIDTIKNKLAIEEISSKFEEDEFLDLINKLESANILLINSNTSTIFDKVSRYIQLISGKTYSPQELKNALSKNIYILNNGGSGEILKELLLQLGFNNVYQFMITHNKNMDSSINLTTMKEKLKDADILLCILDYFDPILPRIINEFAIEENKKWVLSAIDGINIFIGPTFIPKETACYECMQNRLIANQSDSEIFSRVLPNIMNGNWISGKNLMPVTYSYLMASIAAQEAMNLLILNQPMLINRLLIVNTQNFSFSIQKILKLPRCNVCGARVSPKPIYLSMSEILSLNENTESASEPLFLKINKNVE
ncbi:MAG: TOMM precursor leader peptide-binding protein [Thermoplasmata archaeon]